ncbi:MAG: hypothetical protein DMF98_19625, partial [Acidobacteria bacterium]
MLSLGGHRSAADPRRRRSLRHQRKGERRVPGHSLDDGDKSMRIVARPCHQFQRVAVRASAHRRFLLVAAGEARQPLRVRELRGEIACLAKFQIGGRRFLGDERHRRSLQVEADRPNSKSVLPRFES